MVALALAAVLAGCGPSVTLVADADPDASPGLSSQLAPPQGTPPRPAPPATGPSPRETLSAALDDALLRSSGGAGRDAFILPDSDDFAAIPQDPANPLAAERVALGRLLFHDTGFALGGRSDAPGAWSCATCHHAAAGFKSGARQGIGEGGEGFGSMGSERLLAAGFDAHALPDAVHLPDLQPLASPTILNAAWQDVMLWNGQFGNGVDATNAAVEASRLMTEGTPKAVNARGLSGLETQAIAGTAVHRLSFDAGSPLHDGPAYRSGFIAAFGYDPANAAGRDVSGDAGLAIAAFERTVIANRAPFQRWLRGEAGALDETELAGAGLFFGEAGCADCHRGPALSSMPGAAPADMFFAIGFDDLDADALGMHGGVDAPSRLGRGGLTGDDGDAHAFKIPPLYNLADASALGHGASFASVREVIDYKNAGAVQNAAVPAGVIDPRHRPLGLDAADVDALVAFLETGLRDPDLLRYEPASVPGGCVVVGARDPVHGCGAR